MFTPRNAIFIACLTLAVFIGSGVVEANALGNGVPVLLAPGETSPTTDSADAWIVQGRIDAARYEAAPPDGRDRSSPLWLAVTATLTLALAALSPRRATFAVGGVAIAWTIGLAAALAARPAIDRVTAPDGTPWLIARRPGTATVPIVDGAAWVPIVESRRHWQSLAPRIVVAAAADGVTTLALSFPAPGARVALARR